MHNRLAGWLNNVEPISSVVGDMNARSKASAAKRASYSSRMTLKKSSSVSPVASAGIIHGAPRRTPGANRSELPKGCLENHRPL